MGRLNARVFERIEEERDGRRRTRLFGFPQQMAGLRDVLGQFVSDVFASTRFDQPILLRGVYFTSGTQDGTPIDRLLGAIGRRFGVASEAVAASTGRGKAYFVERLLKEVLIGESGLAGVNRRVEMRNAALQLGAYAAMALLAVLGRHRPLGQLPAEPGVHRRGGDGSCAGSVPCRQSPRLRPSRRCCRAWTPSAPSSIRPIDIEQIPPGRCGGASIKAAPSAIPRATPICGSSTGSCCRGLRRV